MYAPYKQKQRWILSSNAPNQQQQQPTRDDIWRSGRRRFGWNQFRQTWQGHDKQWHFSGQEPGEVVRMVVHRHWLFLLPTALPLIGALAFLLALTWLSTFLHEAVALWATLYIVAVLLVLATGIWFLWKGLILWWLETYVITSKRIIDSRGVLQPSRQETPIEKVMQVGLDLDSPLAYVLNYGNVHVYLTGGDFMLKNVPNPRKVKDAIQGISADIKAKKPPEKETPRPQDPELASLLDSLKEGKKPPDLPDADAKYPTFRDPDRVNGPRRTFGYPMRIHADVHYLSGEKTVMYIQRSLYVLYKRLLLPLLGIFLTLSVAAIFPAFNMVREPLSSYWWFIMGLIVFVLLIWMFLTYANYVDDVYILTNKRIIDIERRLSFFFEARAETEYKNIRDIKVKVPNVFERLLDIGNVYIETPGSNPDITLFNVDHPFVVQDVIYGIKGHKEKVDKIENENKEKKEIYNWFGNVMTLMEKKIQSNGAPNLEGKDVVTAMMLASEFDMNVVIKSEKVSPGEPGMVVHQSPPPGTMMAAGGEIHVVVSRRPTPLDMI
jgi:hypothetical protein